MPLLHGSQGCATYIRRYMISHFKEPMDIASSNFSEATAVFGGQDESAAGPGERGAPIPPAARSASPRPAWRKRSATTCACISAKSAPKLGSPMPELVHVSTPSYAGTHAEGFHAAVSAMVETLAEPAARGTRRST